MKTPEYTRSQDFRTSQLKSTGNPTDYPAQLDKWEANEEEKRKACPVCHHGKGRMWDGDKQAVVSCPRCNKTEQKNDNP